MKNINQKVRALATLIITATALSSSFADEPRKYIDNAFQAALFSEYDATGISIAYKPHNSFALGFIAASGFGYPIVNENFGNLFSSGLSLQDNGVFAPVLGQVHEKIRPLHARLFFRYYFINSLISRIFNLYLNVSVGRNMGFASIRKDVYNGLRMDWNHNVFAEYTALTSTYNIKPYYFGDLGVGIQFFLHGKLMRGFFFGMEAGVRRVYNKEDTTHVYNDPTRFYAPNQLSILNLLLAGSAYERSFRKL